MKRKIVALLLAASTLIIGCSPKDMETEMVFVTEINSQNAIAYTLDGEEYSFPKEDTDIGDIYTLILNNGNIVKLKYEGNIASIDNSNAHGNHVLMLSNGSVLPIETTETGLYLHFENGTGYYWER